MNKRKGVLLSINPGYIDGRPLVTFKMSSDAGLDSLSYDVEYDITAEPHRERRSLDANAYFHVINGKIAEALKVSKVFCKNQLIARYGQCELFGNKTVTITSAFPPERVLEWEYPHCLLVHTEQKGGTVWYTYRIYRGSHTYNSREMSVLIDGAVSEAKELGIETMTPAELERIVKAWQRKG